MKKKESKKNKNFMYNSKTLDKNNKQKPSKDSGIYQKLYKEFPEYTNTLSLDYIKKYGN